jgi:hypothetical protein
MVEKSGLFAFDQKVLKKGRYPGRSSGAQRLARISQRWQENVPDEFGGAWFWFRGIKFSGPESRLAARVTQHLALVAHSEDGKVRSRVGYGANQETFDGVAQPREAALNCEVLFGATAAEIIVVGISFPASA